MEIRSISFTKILLKKLKEEEDITGLSRSDIIRRALDFYFENRKSHYEKQ
jgi:metal-responsive CopG/Arc/MetJ family transcriptional regulator